MADLICSNATVVFQAAGISPLENRDERRYVDTGIDALSTKSF